MYVKETSFEYELCTLIFLFSKSLRSLFQQTPSICCFIVSTSCVCVYSWWTSSTPTQRWRKWSTTTTLWVHHLGDMLTTCWRGFTKPKDFSLFLHLMRVPFFPLVFLPLCPPDQSPQWQRGQKHRQHLHWEEGVSILVDDVIAQCSQQHFIPIQTT